MPGPLLTYSIERSLNRGWRTGLLVPLGHVLLEVLVVILLALGLGSILNHPWPKISILFIGGIVLLWFGFGMVKSAVKGNIHIETTAEQTAKKGENLEIIVKSGVISILNPYFLLWWATVGLGLMMSGVQMGVWGIVIFYAGHAMADFTWYFAVSLLCAKIGKLIGGRPYRIIIGVLGGALGFFAVKFIIDGVSLLIGAL